MRELTRMWGNTRMVVLTALSASLYAAILIPFKVLPVIPGVTEFRPANAVPVLCSLLFGPAGAWGAAIGNVIGDFFGGLGPGSVFGFAGNFLYGFVPYAAWRAISPDDPVPRSAGGWVKLMLVIGLAACACAFVVGWGLNLLGFVPFAVLANIIVVNNFLVAGVLTPLLLMAIHPRVERARLLYTDIVPPRKASMARRRFGLLLVIVGAVGGLIAGNMISAGTLVVPGLGPIETGTGAAQIGLGLLPAVVVLVVGMALL